MAETEHNPMPLSITEADLRELEELVETPVKPSVTETRRILDELPAMLTRAQRRMVLFTGMLGLAVAMGVAVFFIVTIGPHAPMSDTSAMETGLIAAAMTATLTYLGAVLVGFGRRAEQAQIDHWMEKLEASLR